MLLKVLWSNKPSGDGPVFQVWRYLNSLIKIKLPFSKQEHLQFSPLPSPSEACALSFDFMLERDAKNIFCHQRDVENYTAQVLYFLLFDKHEYTQGIFQSVVQVSIFMLGVYVTFSLFKIWFTESVLIFRE